MQLKLSLISNILGVLGSIHVIISSLACIKIHVEVSALKAKPITQQKLVNCYLVFTKGQKVKDTFKYHTDTKKRH